ncbi:hypothetical protein [Photobacterium sp. TLY01]|uniref:hypothetical protein n=1 Tax=Photobacterium sp. TLY01 TaxID=2907534 RepID=UPI001F29BC6D|nr:hypothetical protein [Photobacterium sp. TLY01]UIP26880.1 hypothetical protein LN341_09500 [Photobacterium sp. TLY01]
MKRTGLSALVVFFAVLLGACSSTPEVSGTDSTISEQGEFQRILSAYRQWQQLMPETGELAIYSPDVYQGMISSWENAEKIYQEITATPSTAYKSYSLFSSTTYLQQIQLELNQVDSSFNQLKQLQKVADDVLSPAITQMQYLDSLDAKQYYRSEYTRLHRLYASLFTLVEDDELSDAREEQDEFLSRSHSLEVKTIKKIYIAPLEALMIELRRQDVNDYAPNSYAQIERRIEAGKALIERTPRDFDAIQQAANTVQFELAHAQHISLEVRRLRDLSKDDYESYILDFENKLLRISKALKEEDLRDQPIQEQARLIIAGAINVREATASRPPADEVLKDKDKYIRDLNALVMSQQRQISLLQSKLSVSEETQPSLPASSESSDASAAVTGPQNDAGETGAAVTQ